MAPAWAEPVSARRAGRQTAHATGMAYLDAAGYFVMHCPAETGRSSPGARAATGPRSAIVIA
ncbi:hypothetical protein QFZ79_001981 [Arthrobacter sp. V4I6]|nr:hypothetical protein [Arthrobacter sp. V1I7]MDQ0853870.1 hypothetical protein [Arthrobacter sp. V4I6]